MNKTAKDLRESAAAHEAEKEASYQRCDTDGFLSQWAHGMSAAKERAQAAILEAGGVAEFRGLYEGNRRVKAKEIQTKYGFTWLLHEDETALRAARGKPFLPTGKKSRILKEFGLAERKETAPAAACLGGEGKGLSGCANVHVVVFRTGDKWGGDAKLMEGES